jgi:hypothetical protein
MENLPLIGRYSFVVKRAGISMVWRTGKNLMVSTGKNRAANALIGAAPFLGSYLAFGDDATAPELDQTALVGTEVKTRVLLTPSVLDNIIQQSEIIVHAGAPVTVREMGIFSTLTVGVLVSRWLPTEFTFGTGDEMEFTWTLEVG